MEYEEATTSGGSTLASVLLYGGLIISIGIVLLLLILFLY